MVSERIIAQLGDQLGGGDLASWISQIAFFGFFVLYMFYGQRIQLRFMTRNIERALRNMESWASESKERALKTIKEKGKPTFDPQKIVDEYMEFFLLEPVDRDPAGVLRRLEHLLDVRKRHGEGIVSKIAPNAGEEDRADLELVLEVAQSLTYLYRFVRHFLLLGKKTRSLILIMQLEMQMPLIEKLAESYYKAMDGFIKGTPMGDGFGALVAAKFMHNKPQTLIAEEVLMSEVEVDQRNVIVLKAKGPGGRVGKPGDAVAKVVEKYEGKIARIITVDALVKLEGEKTGEIVQGIGAAIGDPGPEKYKMEEAATKYQIPIHAICGKLSMEDAHLPMKKEIMEATDTAVEKITQIIKENTNPGDRVLVVGIGNTLGVAQ